MSKLPIDFCRDAVFRKEKSLILKSGNPESGFLVFMFCEWSYSKRLAQLINCEDQWLTLICGMNMFVDRLWQATQFARMRSFAGEEGSKPGVLRARDEVFCGYRIV